LLTEKQQALFTEYYHEYRIFRPKKDPPGHKTGLFFVGGAIPANG